MTVLASSTSSEKAKEVTDPFFPEVGRPVPPPGVASGCEGLGRHSETVPLFARLRVVAELAWNAARRIRRNGRYEALACKHDGSYPMCSSCSAIIHRMP